MTQPNQPAVRLSGAEGARQLRVFGDTPEQIREQLELAFDRFEASIPAHQGHWLTTPSQGRWSPAQVTEHVIIVNEGVAKLLRLLLSDKGLRELPRTPGVQQGDRYQAPAHLQPGEGQSWESLQPRWQANRELLRDLSAQLENADLSRRMFHPFYDDLDAYDWTRMVTGHLRQHRRQLEE
ncbi:DinB family protein [Deinococcus sp. KNUC1210]|uniref:DinB family protein n=1 Tax=Deinococcus sp. KNUC1210 TaxID=2917691 RepID=UPI001EF0D257|nr:DinB family protein [Deinococcus sp. KNUC1210]ULH15796.1 DinB family protein [Deinococcus sp. KNUC1210]